VFCQQIASNLLAVASHPFEAPTDHLVLESYPETQHTSFKHMCEQLLLLQMLCMQRLFLLYIWARIACRLGHLVGVDSITFKTTGVGTKIVI